MVDKNSLFSCPSRIDWTSGLTIQGHHHLESDTHVTHLTTIVTISTVSCPVKMVWFSCTGHCCFGFLRRILNLIHKWRIAPVLLLDQWQYNARHWELNSPWKIELTLIGVARMWFYKSCNFLRFTGDQSESGVSRLSRQHFVIISYKWQKQTRNFIQNLEWAAIS